MSAPDPYIKAQALGANAEEREGIREQEQARRVAIQQRGNAAPRYGARFGTAARNPTTGRVMPGEVDQRGLPMNGATPNHQFDPAWSQGGAFRGPLPELARYGAAGPDAPLGPPAPASAAAPASPLRSLAAAPQNADGGYGSVTPVVGSSGITHQVQSGVPFMEGMEASHPGFAQMPQAQKQGLLRSLAHDQSGGVNTTPAPVFNSRGESVNDGTGGAGTITYDPRRDIKMAGSDPSDSANFNGDVAKAQLPPGASRGVIIDPKYVPKGGSNIGYGTGGATQAAAAPPAPPPGAPVAAAAGDAPKDDWQHAIVRQYPAIGKAGTPENKAFVDAFRQHGDPAQGMATAHSIMQGRPGTIGRDNPPNAPDASADTGGSMAFTPPPAPVQADTGPTGPGAPLDAQEAAERTVYAAKRALKMSAGMAIASGINSVGNVYDTVRGTLRGLTQADPNAGVIPPASPPPSTSGVNQMPPAAQSGNAFRGLTAQPNVSVPPAAAAPRPAPAPAPAVNPVAPAPSVSLPPPARPTTLSPPVQNGETRSLVDGSEIGPKPDYGTPEHAAWMDKKYGAGKWQTPAAPAPAPAVNPMQPPAPPVAPAPPAPRSNPLDRDPDAPAVPTFGT